MAFGSGPRRWETAKTRELDCRNAAFARPKAQAYVPKILDPYFIAKPSAIWESFLKLGCLRPQDGFVACLGADENNLWFATLVTLKNTWWGFLFGSASGIAAGLVLGRSDLLARISTAQACPLHHPACSQ